MKIEENDIIQWAAKRIEEMDDSVRWDEPEKSKVLAILGVVYLRGKLDQLKGEQL